MAENLAPLNQYQDRLHSLAKLDFNYEEKMYHEALDKSGWNIDHYQAQLGTEPIGAPIQNGAFEAVKKAIRLYKFPDPRLIVAVFDPEQNLPGRNMLLVARFMGFTFEFGVRVTAVVDEQRVNVVGEKVQVWGYSYRTLRGHFEIGEIRFEVSKNLQTGEVDFDINAYSKPDRIPNFFYRIGFKLFGRHLQKSFAKNSIKRLQKIAQSALHQVQDAARA